MAPQLKLTYFNLTARGELTRLVLTYGQIPFEDERIQFHDFPALKPTLPLGQLPVLTVDGEVYAQSIAIARYAAKLSGLYPQEPLEALRVDMVVDTLVESWTPLLTIQYGGLDEATKHKESQKLQNETLPRVFTGLESLIRGEFFLDRLTLADLSLFDHIENGIKEILTDFNLDAYPKLSKLHQRIKSHPHLAQHLAKHQVH